MKYRKWTVKDTVACNLLGFHLAGDIERYDNAPKPFKSDEEAERHVETWAAGRGKGKEPWVKALCRKACFYAALYRSESKAIS